METLGCGLMLSALATHRAKPASAGEHEEREMEYIKAELKQVEYSAAERKAASEHVAAEFKRSGEMTAEIKGAFLDLLEGMLQLARCEADASQEMAWRQHEELLAAMSGNASKEWRDDCAKKFADNFELRKTLAAEARTLAERLHGVAVKLDGRSFV